MRSRSWATLLGLVGLALLPGEIAHTQDATGSDWIFVADKLSLLQKYVEGSEMGRNLKDRNLRARLTAFETAALLLPPAKNPDLFEVRINVRRSTRLETFVVPREDYEALVKFARERARATGRGPRTQEMTALQCLT